MATEFNMIVEYDGWEKREAGFGITQPGNYILLGVGGATLTARVKMRDEELDKIPEGCFVEITGIIKRSDGKRSLAISKLVRVQAHSVEIHVRDRGKCEFYVDNENLNRAKFVCPSDTYSTPKGMNLEGLQEGVEYIIDLAFDTFTRITNTQKRLEDISLYVKDARKVVVKREKAPEQN